MKPESGFETNNAMGNTPAGHCEAQSEIKGIGRGVIETTAELGENLPSTALRTDNLAMFLCVVVVHWHETHYISAKVSVQGRKPKNTGDCIRDKREFARRCKLFRAA